MHIYHLQQEKRKEERELKRAWEGGGVEVLPFHQPSHSLNPQYIQYAIWKCMNKGEVLYLDSLK
jgi:hypothetical protein